MAKRQLKFPMLIQVKEKHSNYVKIVNNVEEIQALALEVAKYRKENNYYWLDESIKEETTFEEFYEARYGMIPEEIEKLLIELGGDPETPPHEEKIKFDISVQGRTTIKGSFHGLSEAKRDFSMRKLENQNLLKFFEGLEKEDGAVVMRFLFSRSRDGYDYEGFDYIESNSDNTFDLS